MPGSLLFISRREFVVGNWEQQTLRKCSSLVVLPNGGWSTKTPQSSMGLSTDGFIVSISWGMVETWKVELAWRKRITGVCSWGLCLVNGFPMRWITVPYYTLSLWHYILPQAQKQWNERNTVCNILNCKPKYIFPPFSVSQVLLLELFLHTSCL